MKNGVSVLSGRPLPRDSKVVQPDRPSETLSRVQATAVMVKEQSESIAQQCRNECTQLEEQVSSAVRLVRRMTVERQITLSAED